MPLIYHYSDEGYFMGSQEAQLDPIDELPLVPLNSTLDPIPDYPEGSIAQYVDGAWRVVEDPRLAAEKETVALKEKARKEYEGVQNLQKVNQFGVRLYEKQGEEVVEKSQQIVSQETTEAAWEHLRRERNAKLSETDHKMLPDSGLSDAKKAEFVAYRASLRNIPSTVQDPTQPVAWPQLPSKE